MTRFILNSQPRREAHEIHSLDHGCKRLPIPMNQIDLGIYESSDAAEEATARLCPGLEITWCGKCDREVKKSSASNQSDAA